MLGGSELLLLLPLPPSASRRGSVSASGKFARETRRADDWLACEAVPGD